jgi:hypothetical protein
MVRREEREEKFGLSHFHEREGVKLPIERFKEGPIYSLREKRGK